MFELYNTINYKGKDICDITQRYIFQKQMIDSGTCIDYIIKDWISIENLSYQLYSDTKYYWTIILANNIIDPFYDWILKPNELDILIKMKYDNPTGIHHYEDENGLLYWPEQGRDYPDCKAVSNEEYEYDKNEKKRKIKIINPDYIGTVSRDISMAGG